MRLDGLLLITQPRIDGATPVTALVPFAIGTGWLRKLTAAARDHPARTGTAVVTVAGVAVMRVASVPADEGVWVIAGDSDRTWVLLSGAGESPFCVRAGQRLDFVGRVIGRDERFVGRVGLSAREGAAELRRDGYHVEVSRKD
jgi:hypothetical protein